MLFIQSDILCVTTHTSAAHTRPLFDLQHQQSEIVVEMYNQVKKLFSSFSPPLLSGAAGNVWTEGTTESVVIIVRLPHAGGGGGGGGVPMQEASVAPWFPDDDASSG